MSKPEEPAYYIDKKGGARHLLHAAIRLTLECEDAFGINLLAQSADKILLDLLKHKKIDDPMMLEESIVPERKKEFFRLYRQSFNFLKHADVDANSKLAVRNIITANEMLLFANVTRYRRLFSECTVHMQKLFALVTLLHPTLIRWKDMGETGEQFLTDRKTFEHMTRHECIAIIRNSTLNDGQILQEKATDLKLVYENNSRLLSGEQNPNTFRISID